MLVSTFTTVWRRLSPETRDRLVRDPARRLDADDVDDLARAGAREAHAVWLDSRPGRPRQWATSWAFRRFLERVQDDEPTGSAVLHRRREYR